MAAPRWQVILVAPEIAANTGNVIRLCANAGAALHLVEPLGFSLDDKRVRRGGLDYHELTSVAVHADLAGCLASIGAAPRCFALSGRGTHRYDEVSYQGDEVLVFGAERTGLTEADMARFPPACRLAIPMRPDNRSLNLANAVAVVLFEAWRQLGFEGAAEPATSRATLAEAPGAPAFDVT